MKINWLFLYLPSLLIQACFSPHLQNAPSLDNITNIQLLFPGKTITATQVPYKVISTSTEIRPIVEFLSKCFDKDSTSRFSLCNLLYAPGRSCFLTLNLFEGDRQKVTIGIGSDGKGTFFLSYFDNDRSHYKCLSASETDSIFGLIKVTREEYQTQLEKFSKPATLPPSNLY